MSLINEALRRADAENGPPRRPAPPPPPAPATPGKHTLAPQPAPAVALPRESSRWRTIQAVVLGVAFVTVAVAGAVIWKVIGNSPAEVVAAPALPATLSSAAAPPLASAAQKQAAPEPASEKAGGSPAPRPAASAPSRPQIVDPLPATTGLANSVKDVFASPPTLFLDARKSQSASIGDAPLTPPEIAPAAIAANAPVRLSSAFAAPAAGAPRPAAPMPAATPIAPPAAVPAPAAPAAEAPKLKVSSIFYQTKAPTAIINGQVIGVGETIDGATVLSITPRSVEVIIDGKRVTLRL
jgi:hypothetical protein